MKFGCGIVLLLMAGLLAGTIWVSVQCLRAPDIASAPISSTREPGFRIEHHGAERSSRVPPQGKGHSALTLSAGELSRLIARQLAEGDKAPSPVVRVGLRPGQPAEIAFTRPLAPLFRGALLSAITARMPAAWLAHPVWIDVHVTPHVEKTGPGGRHRYLRLEVRDFAVGRQRLPPLMARLLVEPDALRLRWPLPDGVEELTIETDRVLVRVVS